MYLSYPPPDDERLAGVLAAVGDRAAKRMTETPALYRGRPDQHRRWPARRKGSDRPLRLLRVRRPDAGRQKPAVRTAAATPEERLREAVLRARNCGVSLADLAGAAGVSEKTLRRRLVAPDTIPLGEYRSLLRAARRAAGEGCAR